MPAILLSPGSVQNVFKSCHVWHVIGLRLIEGGVFLFLFTLGVGWDVNVHVYVHMYLTLY